MKHVLSYLCTRPWAITERAMDTIFTVVARENDIEAVAARLGQPLENTGNRVEQRGGTAVLSVEGPLFRYANLFTRISGATSVELLGRDLQTALDDPRVESILLNVNSPGGEADGISELAGMIREARAKKPVWSYVGGWAASGGYWLAAAAERIVFHKSAFGGSIGVIATVTDDSKRRERDGYAKYEIVSSQSPLKRVDPATDEGAAVIKTMVDSMAALFIDEVAEFRNTTGENVQENYGKGFVIDSTRAISVGMADEVGTFEGVVARLNGEERRSGRVITMAAAAADVLVTESGDSVIHAEVEEVLMADEKQPNVLEMRTAERTRIAAILGCEEATGRTALARHLALETDMEPDAARKALAASVAEPKPVPATEQKPDQFAEHMKKLPNPAVGIGEEGVAEVDQEIARVTAFLPRAQRRTA